MYIYIYKDMSTQKIHYETYTQKRFSTHIQKYTNTVAHIYTEAHTHIII